MIHQGSCRPDIQTGQIIDYLSKLYIRSIPSYISTNIYIILLMCIVYHIVKLNFTEVQREQFRVKRKRMWQNQHLHQN